MCFNTKASLLTYVFSLFFSTLLFIYGDKYDKHIAIYCYVFIQVQISEYFMWKDQMCGKINHYATMFVHIMLLLQPIQMKVVIL